MKVLISGASGLIGTELQKQLIVQGHTPLLLVRRPAKNSTEIEWNPIKHELDSKQLESIDAVVNLAGATTGKLPWTKKYKSELISSRLDSTKTIVEAIAKTKNKPKVLVSGSASGFYGDQKDGLLTESSPKGSGFLSDLSAQWEQEALKATGNTRVVLVRTTMVFSRKLGALGRLLPLIRLGVAGSLGSGKQWWAFISLPDEARAIIHLINTPTAHGVYNLTAPEAATCKQIITGLGNQMHRPTLIPIPAFSLKLAFREGASELLLCSQKMSAEKLLATGFVFEHPTLKSACQWVCSKSE
jgi:uncharacterized protein (TIGR01777 family)